MHRYGVKVAVQINHAGASAMRSRTGTQPVSVSDIPSKEGGELPRPLTREELAAIAGKYGAAAKRARFPRIVLEMVREAVGQDFPIIVRVSADAMTEGGNRLEDSIELMRLFCQEANLFNVSCGLNSPIQYQIDP